MTDPAPLADLRASRPHGPGSRPPPRVGADTAAATRRRRAGGRAARSPASCASRGPRAALSGRAAERGARLRLGPASERESERAAAAARTEHSQPAAVFDPTGRPVPSSPSGRSLPDSRPPWPRPRRPVPREVVDETWLTPTLESLVCRRRLSPCCGCCLRAASSPSAILYRFKINSPLTSNAAAALSTSRELAGRPAGPSAALCCAAQPRPSAPSLRLRLRPSHPAPQPSNF